MKKILSFLFLFNTVVSFAQTEDYYGPVKISFHGFICNRPTNDDPLGMDGVSDEVTVDFWSWNPVTTNRARYAGIQRIYGEDFLLPQRIKAGTATINGGIKAGDSYYRGGVYGDDDLNILSDYDIVNTFCSNSTMIAIFPAIFERDEGVLSTSPLQDMYLATQRAFSDPDIQNAIWSFSDSYTYNDTDPYGFFLAGRHIGLDAKYAGLYTANKNKLASRPIGLFSNWDYSSQLIILTPKTIKIIAEKDYGYGKGILPVMFNEETMGNTVGHGNYIVLLRIKADIKDRNAGNQPTNLRTISVKVNNASPGEEYKFRLWTFARYDTITIKHPNTTVNFPQRIAHGQQYNVVQTAGPRSCQLNYAVGAVSSEDIVVTANCAVVPTQHRIGVKVNAVGVGERFMFSTGNGISLTVWEADQVVYFPVTYPSGQSFTISKTFGPRPCQFVPSVVSVTNQDVIVTCDCGLPPTDQRIGVRVNFVDDAERFEFTTNDGRTITVNESNKVVYFDSTFRTGDAFTIRQLSGPRSCGLTPNTGTIDHDDIIIDAGCGTVSPKAFLGGKLTAPKGTKIVLLKNKVEELSVVQSEGTMGSMGTTAFKFPKSFPAGTEYTVTFKTAPGDIGCRIYENGEGRLDEQGSSIGVVCDRSHDLISRSTDNKILATYYESWAPVIGGIGEDEGRYVAFNSSAKGIDGSSGKYRQIFLRDRKTGVTKLISKAPSGEEANANNHAPAISADGKTVAFESYATNLSPGDNNGVRDVYAWNEQTGQVTLISQSQVGNAGNSESYEPTVSGDGSVIAYTSNASDIVTLGPVFSTPNVYVYNGGSTVFITKDYESGKAVGGYSPSVSEDGTKIAFCAYTSRLVKDDNNNLWDIFLWQSGMPGLKRISLTSSGAERNQGTESASRVVAPSISGDGRYVVYATTASNMVPGDNNAMQDIFICSTSGGSVKRVSETGNTESNGDSPIGQGEKIGISYDGKWITYNTNADNLGASKGNIVLQNTTSGQLIPVTTITGGSTARPMVSRGGAYVVAGCSERYDKRFQSSGLFVFLPPNN